MNRTPLATRILLLLAASVSLLGAAGGSATAAEHPNVVVIVADDLGWDDVGFHGGAIETPSLDRLASEGTELDHFYTTPICSPTRSALMTARDPIRLGVVYATFLAWDTSGVSPEEHFMPQSFKAAGYQMKRFFWLRTPAAGSKLATRAGPSSSTSPSSRRTRRSTPRKISSRSMPT